jgi:predicted TIM-barrel enzyme
MDILNEGELDAVVKASKLINKYNRTIDAESAYELLTAKLDEAVKKTQEKQDDNTTVRTGNKREGSFFDHPAVRQAERTAASILTRSLLGALGLGGRSRRSKSLW